MSSENSTRDPHSPSLSDEEFDDLLHDGLRCDLLEHGTATGDGFADDESGLQQEDAADLALMHQALESYRAETLRFAEEQSAAMPAPRLGRVAALWSSTPQRAVAAAALVAVAAGTGLFLHRNTADVSVASSAPPSAETLRDDDRLLLSIHQAIENDAAPTEQELGLSAMPTRTIHFKRTTN